MRFRSCLAGEVASPVELRQQYAGVSTLLGGRQSAQNKTGSDDFRDGGEGGEHVVFLSGSGYGTASPLLSVLLVRYHTVD